MGVLTKSEGALSGPESSRTYEEGDDRGTSSLPARNVHSYAAHDDGIVSRLQPTCLSFMRCSLLSELAKETLIIRQNTSKETIPL